VAGPFSPDRAPTNALTIYYDGSCPLCSAEINYYSSKKGGDSLKLIDVSELNAPLGRNLTNSAALKRFHVRRADGELLSGAAAFVAVWNELPAWKWLASVARIPGLILALELLYRVFLQVRPFISTAFSKLTR
jgi:predicted DCC family thiol-disulfide oxidoreductase YuxK